MIVPVTGRARRAGREAGAVETDQAVARAAADFTTPGRWIAGLALQDIARKRETSGAADPVARTAGVAKTGAVRATRFIADALPEFANLADGAGREAGAVIAHQTIAWPAAHLTGAGGRIAGFAPRDITWRCKTGRTADVGWGAALAAEAGLALGTADPAAANPGIRAALTSDAGRPVGTADAVAHIGEWATLPGDAGFPRGTADTIACIGEWAALPTDTGLIDRTAGAVAHIGRWATLTLSEARLPILTGGDATSLAITDLALARIAA